MEFGDPQAEVSGTSSRIRLYLRQRLSINCLLFSPKPYLLRGREFRTVEAPFSEQSSRVKS